MRESPVYIIALGVLLSSFFYFVLFLRKPFTDFLLGKKKVFIIKILMQNSMKIFGFCHLEITTINTGFTALTPCRVSSHALAPAKHAALNLCVQMRLFERMFSSFFG